MTKLIRYFMAFIILAVSFILLLWSFWPQDRETRILTIPPAELSLPTSEGQ
jgi:hypothetical protein